MKKQFLVLGLCLCLIFSACCAETAYITDSAGVFESTDVQKLVDVCSDIERIHGYLVRVETSDKPLSTPIQEHAKTVFESRYGADASGCLYFIDAAANAHYLHLSSDLAAHITPDGTEDAKKSFENGDYVQASVDAVFSVYWEWDLYLDKLEQDSQLNAEAENITEKTEELTQMVKDHFLTIQRIEKSALDEAIEARKAKRDLLSELHTTITDYISYLMQYQDQIVQLLAE